MWVLAFCGGIGAFLLAIISLTRAASRGESLRGRQEWFFIIFFGLVFSAAILL